MLDVPRLEGRGRAPGRLRRIGQRRFDVAGDDAAAAQHVVGIARVHRFAAPGRCERCVDVFVRRLGAEANRHLALGQGHDSLGIADDGEHRLATKPGDAFGEHRLVAQIGKDRERVARHVDGRDHVDDAGPAAAKGYEVADLEGGMRVRRPDDAHRQNRLACARPLVGAEALFAQHLGRRIEACHAAADSAAR